MQVVFHLVLHTLEQAMQMKQRRKYANELTAALQIQDRP
jgi:hypothetical protein